MTLHPNLVFVVSEWGQWCKSHSEGQIINWVTSAQCSVRMMTEGIIELARWRANSFSSQAEQNQVIWAHP